MSHNDDPNAAFKDFNDWQARLPSLPPNPSNSDVLYFLAQMSRVGTSATLVLSTTVRQNTEGFRRFTAVMERIEKQLAEMEARSSDGGPTVAVAVAPAAVPAPVVEREPTAVLLLRELRQTLEILPTIAKTIPSAAWVVFSLAVLGVVLGAWGLTYYDGNRRIGREDAPGHEHTVPVPASDLTLPDAEPQDTGAPALPLPEPSGLQFETRVGVPDPHGVDFLAPLEMEDTDAPAPGYRWALVGWDSR